MLGSALGAARDKVTKRRGIALDSLWLRYLGAFVLILLPSLASYFVFYRVASDAIRSSIIENKLNDVGRCATDMDRSLYELKRMMLYYQRDTALLGIDTKDRMDAYDHWVLKQRNEQYALSIPIVEDILFYIPRDDLVVTSSGSFAFDQFFDRLMSNPVRNKYFWREYLGESAPEQTFPAEPYVGSSFASPSVTRELIVMVTPKSTFRHMRLVILLNAGRIADLYGRDLLVFDASATPLLGDTRGSQGMVERVRRGGIGLGGGTGYSADADGYAFYAPSQSYPWYYAKIVSYAKVYGDLQGFNRIALGIVACLLFIGLLLSYVLSHRLSRPMQNIIDMVSPDRRGQRGQGGTEEQKVFGYLRSVSRDYESIARKYSSMRDDFLEFFLGMLAADPSLAYNRRIFRELSIDPAEFAQFFVLCYSLGGGAHARGIDAALRRLVELPGGKRTCHCLRVEKGLRMTVVTFAGDEGWVAGFRQKLGAQLGTEAGAAELILAVGRVFHGAAELGAACEDAAMLHRNHSLRGGLQVLCHESLRRAPMADHWKDFPDKVKCLVELSKYSELRDAFDEMLRHSEARDIPAAEVQRGLEATLTALVEGANGSLDRERFQALYRELDSCVSMEDFARVTRQAADFVGGAAGPHLAAGQSVGQAVVQRICQYLEESYASFDISLRSLADRHKMSPAYLSRLFLEHKRVRYSDFLADVRMRKARESLERGDVRIKDLATTVGYRNANVFIKAFRRRFGVSPGEYKRLLPASRSAPAPGSAQATL